MKNRHFLFLPVIAMTVLSAAFLLSDCSFISEQTKTPDDAYRPLLGGILAVDLGDFYVDKEKVEISHTFSLTNQTERTLVIKDIKTSCGCTSGVPNKMVIEPSESFAIDSQLVLYDGGPRSETLWLFFEDESVETLSLTARGLLKSQVAISHTSVLLTPESKKVVTLFVINESDTPDEPAAPVFVSSESIETSFGGWNQVYTANDSIGRGYRWEGHVEIRCSADIVPDDARLNLSLANKKFTVRLNGWAW